MSHRYLRIGSQRDAGGELLLALTQGPKELSHMLYTLLTCEHDLVYDAFLPRHGRGVLPAHGCRAVEVVRQVGAQDRIPRVGRALVWEANVEIR